MRAFRLALPAFVLLGLFGTPLRAADRHDHDAARHALERGEVKPLAEILPRVAPSLGGDVVGVEFERDDGRWVYELRVLTPNGRRREVYVDARDGRILKWKDQ
jgi:uncharacterized membrane protein YkoI